MLSLFPGIGLLDMAFEEEDFCVFRERITTFGVPRHAPEAVAVRYARP